MGGGDRIGDRTAREQVGLLAELGDHPEPRRQTILAARQAAAEVEHLGHGLIAERSEVALLAGALHEGRVGADRVLIGEQVRFEFGPDLEHLAELGIHRVQQREDSVRRRG